MDNPNHWAGAPGPDCHLDAYYSARRLLDRREWLFIGRQCYKLLWKAQARRVGGLTVSGRRNSHRILETPLAGHSMTCHEPKGINHKCTINERVTAAIKVRRNLI